MIEITNREAESLKEFIKYDLIDAVRNNLDDDYCIEWLSDICRMCWLLQMMRNFMLPSWTLQVGKMYTPQEVINDICLKKRDEYFELVVEKTADKITRKAMKDKIKELGI